MYGSPERPAGVLKDDFSGKGDFAEALNVQRACSRLFLYLEKVGPEIIALKNTFLLPYELIHFCRHRYGTK